jgi:hypothetical protein
LSCLARSSAQNAFFLGGRHNLASDSRPRRGQAVHPCGQEGQRGLRPIVNTTLFGQPKKLPRQSAPEQTRDPYVGVHDNTHRSGAPASPPGFVNHLADFFHCQRLTSRRSSHNTVHGWWGDSLQVHCISIRPDQETVGWPESRGDGLGQPNRASHAKLGDLVHMASLTRCYESIIPYDQGTVNAAHCRDCSPVGAPIWPELREGE